MQSSQGVSTPLAVPVDKTDSASSTTALDAAKAHKQPPPESQEGVWLRRWVVASFWAVVVLLGLPVWWKTTAIYRAELPLQDMSDWADGKLWKPTFPLRIAVAAPLPPQDAYQFVQATQHALNDLNDYSAHRLRLLLADTPPQANASQQVVIDGAGIDGNDKEIALLVRLIPVETGQSLRSHLQPYAPTLDVYYTMDQLSPSPTATPPLANYVAQQVYEIFAEEQVRLAYLSSTVPGNSVAYPRALTSDRAAELQRQSTRTLKYAPTYHLTFSLFNPTSVPSAWDIDGALKHYMLPLLESFSSISKFTIDSQVQLYAAFSPSIQKPQYDEQLKAWTLRKEDLSGFVNAAEWPLSPSIGEGPTVNFALYVPEADQSPLMIAESGTNSWLVPQWGGVIILNPQDHRKSTPATLTREALAPAIQIFSEQLSSLLGLPNTPASLPLRLSTLTRVRAVSLISSASSTLGALAQVYQKLPSIPVPDSVAKSVDLALLHLQHASDHLQRGRYEEALKHARIADGEAERAFFERSMVGQVYFPDEHKIAVYLPLLGPVAVPLLMAAIKELKAGIAAVRKR